MFSPYNANNWPKEKLPLPEETRKKKKYLGYAAVVSSFLCLILLTKTCDSDHEYERMQEQVAISWWKMGEIQASLWRHNATDMDLHVVDPTGEKIYYRHKESASWWKLDVDKNAMRGSDTTNLDRINPVENITRSNPNKPPISWKYEVYVDFFATRDSIPSTEYTVYVKVWNTIQKLYWILSKNSEPKKVYEFTYPPTQ